MPSLGTKYSFCRPAAGKGLPDAPGLLDIFVVRVRAEETAKLTIMVLKKKGKEEKKRNKQLSRERERERNVERRLKGANEKNRKVRRGWVVGRRKGAALVGPGLGPLW